MHTVSTLPLSHLVESASATVSEHPAGTLMLTRPALRTVVPIVHVNVDPVADIFTCLDDRTSPPVWTGYPAVSAIPPKLLRVAEMP
ncbi:hypothetical protein D3C81_1997890 [compost metagenome]